MRAPSYEESFFERVRAGKVVFLAGSGISFPYPSCLPSSPSMMSMIGGLSLPQEEEELNNLVLQGELQPEVFYGRLQRMVGDKPLGVFRVLGATDCLEIPLGPTLSHLFLVDYAQKNNVPILTTNFDLRFEEAAGMLEAELPIWTPACRQKPGLCTSIVKVHGTLSTDNDSTSSLCATMPRIVAPNPALIEMLEAAAQEYCLCLVGYSGRDIDLFPILRDAYGRSCKQTVYWIDPYANRARQFREDSLHAVAISAALDELVPSMVGELRRYEAAQDFAHLRQPCDAKEIAERLVCRTKRILEDSWPGMSQAQRMLFLVLCLTAAGKNVLALEYLAEHYDKMMNDLGKRDQVVAALARSHLSDCVSKYIDCVKFADEASQRLNRAVTGECSLPEQLALRVQIGDAKLMGRKMQAGPDVQMGYSDVDFTPSRTKLLMLLLFGYLPFVLYSRLLLSLAAVFLRPFRWRLVFHLPKPEDQVFLLDGWYKYSGAYIMLVTFWVRIVQALPGPSAIKLRHLKWLAAFRRRIDVRIGNALGIAHWDKLIHQLDKTDNAADRAYEEYALLTNPLNAARPHRTAGESLLQKGRKDDAAKEFSACLQFAKLCGSQAEALKAYAGLIACGIPPDRDELSRIKDCIQGEAYTRFVDRLIMAAERVETSQKQLAN